MIISDLIFMNQQNFKVNLDLRHQKITIRFHLYFKTFSQIFRSRIINYESLKSHK
jgi:hypothetical protein